MSLGSSGPSPINLEQSTFWSEWTGSWSTSFRIGLGTPAQQIDVQPTEGQTLNLTVPISRGCSGGLPEICAEGLFHPDRSSTWQPVGLEGFAPEDPRWIDGLERIDYEPGDFGYDSVLMGVDDDAPRVSNTSVFGFTRWFLEMGRLGIRPFEGGEDDVHTPSVLSQLKMDSLIPSLSWAYTPGSFIGDSSLTLGGYDASLLPNGQLGEAFEMADTPATAQPRGHSETGDKSDLVVTVSAIRVWDNSTEGSRNTTAAYSTPFEACFSIGMPGAHLPSNARQMLDDAIFDANSTSTGRPGENGRPLSNMVNTSVVSFDLSSAGGLSAGTIDVPVLALFQNTSSDAPPATIREGYYTVSDHTEDGRNMATLGTAILQNAYLIADYERRTFYVSPLVRRQQGLQSNIQPILSLDPPESEQSDGGRSRGENAAIGVSVSLVTVFILIIAFVYFRKRRDALKAQMEKNNVHTDSSSGTSEAIGELNEEAASQNLDSREILEKGDGCVHELPI